MSESADPLVYFQCVSDGPKLRVRIISPGYNREANCQFPRAIRVPGRKYSAPASYLRFARGSAGKFFYRVRKAGITVLDDGVEVKFRADDVKVKLDKVYGEEDDPTCVICLSEERSVVIVPCGHYCMCTDCAGHIAHSTQKCPMCRGRVDLVVTRENIQT